MHADADRGGVRLAELVAALSLGIDLGFDQPMEHVLRQCLIALRLAEQAGVDDHDRAAVYYASLLINVGCHSDAHEQAKWFGDDIAMKADKYTYGVHGGLRGAMAGVRRIGSGANGLTDRVRVRVEFAVSGYRDVSSMITHHSVMTQRLGAELDLPPDVLEALGAAYEQWDGKGWPGSLRGDDVPIATRLSAIGEFAEVAHRTGGVEAARDVVRKQRGKQFDPRLADEFDTHAEILLSELDSADTWDAVIGAEPSLAVVLTDDQFDAALLAIADFIDLKSPYSLGHARAVGDLVTDAATRLGLSAGEIRTLRRAGLAHSFGKLGVSNAILDKPTPLTAGERERIRMVPYLTERMLRQSPVLAPVGALAVQHGERLDGSGYPHGLSGAAISRPARVLAAADAYQSMREPRAHREAYSADDAAKRLRDEVLAGRLDSDAVEAVLEAAGHRTSRRRSGPAGLTAREIDVLRLLARGLTNKEIADRLVISRKTVANHVEHIYTKIGASTRAAAGLFATQHGLLGDEEPVSV
jgi:HD-GYP domain-containing protein (c-di-GMP phosphodiesterase class II)